MSGKKNNQFAGELAEIIQALADVWPNDRENVMAAGARFEDVIEGLADGSIQLEKLINFAWEGMKHLYEKDIYFMSVKTATMQGINTIREYVLADGNIPVEDFERACDQLEKALSGGGESADKVIELEEAEQLKRAGKRKNSGIEEDEAKPNEVTIDDLASYVLMLNEETAASKEIGKIVVLLRSLLEMSRFQSNLPLKDALDKTEEALSSDGAGQSGWLEYISDKIEEAIEIAADEKWMEEGGDKGKTTAKDDKIQAVKTKPEEAAENQHLNEKEIFIIPADTEIGMLGEFVTECSDLIEMAESALLELEKSPNDSELINTVFRAFHTIKGTSAFMGLDPVSEFTHSVETLLSMVREGDLQFDMACADITLESIDILKRILQVVESAKEGDPLPTPNGYERMMRILDHVCLDSLATTEALKKEGPREEPEAEKNTEIVKEQELGRGLYAGDHGPNAVTERGGQKAETESTVRVNVSRLDRLIDMVGELVIAHSVVAQDNSIAEDSDLMKKVNHTTKILRELQDTSLILRMVPLKATFHKMNRLVRDLAKKAGKSVKFSTIGEETEIDRNMVDIINEPLIHMLRNSLDHGIETPDQRGKTDKPEVANIWLRAYQEGGKVVIEIQDDGKGIDKEKVLAKGVEKGLVDPEKKLTDSEIFSLIFLPGFSSADKVTDLSGRGVGMDVVRRSIEQLQGKVEVSSKQGEGTKVSLEIPFTLAITDGMLVKVGEQRFIIPTINIDMTFRAVENDLYTMMGSSEQVSFRGQSVPVIRLHKLFGIQGAVENLLEGTLLIIKNNNKRYALLLDEVIGQQQLVGKSINMMVKMPHISGGAILGDGRVGLILDTAAVVN